MHRLQGDLQILTIAKYLFRLRAETTIRLPPDKGSAFHGAFGHALKRISPFITKRSLHRAMTGPSPNPLSSCPLWRARNTMLLASRCTVS